MQNELQQKEQNSVWAEYDRFKKDYENSLKTNIAFPIIVREFMDSSGLTIEALQAKSKIDRRTICRLRSGLIKTKTREMEYLPNMKTIIAFCIACDLDVGNAITLLEALGLSFKRTSKIHYAYLHLITYCRGKTITECNNVLESFEIDREYFLRDDV